MGVAEVNLTQGYKAIIDDDDAALVSQYKWHARVIKGRVYAKSQRRINGKRQRFFMHRLICGIDLVSGIYVDHKNRDSLDNRKQNLRIATHTENNRNHGKTRGLSAYKGACWIKETRRWVSRIRVNNRLLYLGSYKNETDAAMAYDKAARLYHGDFAAPNFIDVSEWT